MCRFVSLSVSFATLKTFRQGIAINFEVFCCSCYMLKLLIMQCHNGLIDSRIYLSHFSAPFARHGAGMAGWSGYGQHGMSRMAICCEWLSQTLFSFISDLFNAINRGFRIRGYFHYSRQWNTLFKKCKSLRVQRAVWCLFCDRAFWRG